MRLVIAIVGIMVSGSVWADEDDPLAGRPRFDCDLNGRGCPSHIIAEDQITAVYSTPAPNRDWNLLIESADHIPSLTTHLSKEECEKLSSALFNRILPSFSECFETPK